MNGIDNKQSLSDFTKTEFESFVSEIISASGGEEYQEKLISIFERVVPHPDGTDLIFWAPDDEVTPQIITKKIEDYCAQNNHLSFKS